VALAATIDDLVHKHKGTYGSPRIIADLREMGRQVRPNTVAALMAGVVFRTDGDGEYTGELSAVADAVAESFNSTLAVDDVATGRVFNRRQHWRGSCCPIGTSTPVKKRVTQPTPGSTITTPPGGTPPKVATVSWECHTVNGLCGRHISTRVDRLVRPALNDDRHRRPQRAARPRQRQHAGDHISSPKTAHTARQWPKLRRHSQ
jgi:hypothetical protein